MTSPMISRLISIEWDELVAMGDMEKPSRSSAPNIGTVMWPKSCKMSWRHVNKLFLLLLKMQQTPSPMRGDGETGEVRSGETERHANA